MVKREKIIVNSMLFSASLLYGSSYALRKLSLLYVGAFFFNAWRFASSFIVLLAAYLINERIQKNRVLPDPEIALMPFRWQVRGGFFIGLALGLAVNIQQLGLITSNAGKCGFITALYIVVTPMISCFILKKRIPTRIWVGAGIAVIGLFFISMGSSFNIVIGDMLFLLTAVFGAIHIILIDVYVTRSNPLLLLTMQMITISTMSTVLSLIFEDGNTLEGLSNIIFPVLYTGVITIAIGNLLQFVAQKKASPSVTAIMISLESVFAALFAAIIISERMNAPQISGCALIFAAIIISQIEKKPKAVE